MKSHLIKTSLILGCASLFITTSVGAQSFRNAEHAVQYRQGAFKVMGVHMSNLGAMAQGKVAFDAQTALKDAQVLDALSALPFKAFTADTQKISASTTKSKVWSDRADFDKGALEMQKQTAALLKAAQAQDKTAIASATAALGKTCKSCHDAYRE